MVFVKAARGKFAVGRWCWTSAGSGAYAADEADEADDADDAGYTNQPVREGRDSRF